MRLETSLFDNCNCIYFKNCNDFFKKCFDKTLFIEKIIVTDSEVIYKICNIYGIICIINTDPYTIPDSDIDIIVTTSSDKQTFDKAYPLKKSIYFYDTNEKYCAFCEKSLKVDSIINVYCSETCAINSSGFGANKELKNLDHKNHVRRSQIGSFGSQIVISPQGKTESEKKKNDKQDKIQSSIIKDAIRLQYALKREEYKKEMRQPSLRKTSSSLKKEHNYSDKICIGITKKGNKCSNKVIGSSNYCGIISHSMQSG